MQLEKVVNFHKALADPTRVKMLILLANDSHNGLYLAEKLGVTPATITHHSSKLRQAGLISERRDKNTVYFSLNHEVFRSFSRGAEQLIDRQINQQEVIPMNEELEKFKQSVIRNFYGTDGALKQIPVQLKKKLIVLEEMVQRLESGKSYPEKDLNAFIKQFHMDFATIRREFIIHQYMYRENNVYVLNPPEMWTKWQDLK
ncbi:MAG: transcriptional regulator, ArsR family [Paenibacillaceae bacterium]|jgi:hypothetical protein|nr:transcriptional regulator, ArsR family [Paenibacillaceae bacterium]